MVFQEQKPHPRETEWSRKGDDLVELHANDLEPIDEPAEKNVQPKRAEIATAYGGSVANEQLGNARLQAEEHCVAEEKSDQEKEGTLRENGVKDVYKKLEAGMSLEDLQELVKDKLQQIEEDIDFEDVEDGQETIVKDLYMQRSVLDAQQQEIQKLIAKREAA